MRASCYAVMLPKCVLSDLSSPVWKSFALFYPHSVRSATWLLPGMLRRMFSFVSEILFFDVP
jgi:hypothetical protein